MKIDLRLIRIFVNLVHSDFGAAFSVFSAFSFPLTAAFRISNQCCCGLLLPPLLFSRSATANLHRSLIWRLQIIFQNLFHSLV